MRIAIASTGNSIESNIGHQFGRSPFFVVYDTETKSLEFIPNPHKDKEEGAGQAAVELVASRNIHKILSGDFGLKIKPLLDSLKIQMIVLKNSDKTISDIIEMLNH